MITNKYTAKIKRFANTNKKVSKSIKNFLFELIFPTQCIGCGKYKKILCNKCLKTIKPLDLQVCPSCEKAITMNGEICNTCRQKFNPPIDRLLVVADYQDKLLSRTIHLFKYKFIQKLAKPLGELMINNTQKLTIPPPDFILPIPLHPRRLRWRGFNQAKLLADILATDLLPGIKLSVINDLIIRQRHTIPQKKVKKYKYRHKNLDGVFIINKKFNWQKFLLSSNDLTGKNILIVDDVTTTGATIFKFSKELKKLKPKSISVIVLGRQH
jgi:ComF family protein